ncbi:ferritin-like domain-containing protein [Vulgatibacter incomptus]|uniref:Uncharacterized protein n=1 Tax=Vulgatibacter incomptus TaxID=1391653 RepID=A0A0K1PAR3_9BACT|nr:DUF455 family protein [Vulgatibacter incomptus]AKU90501.1 hypothetical protein AKJ08_0888 [Vulgatibacter incomptus]
MKTVNELCRTILESGDLASKLLSPRDIPRLDDPMAPALHIDRPARGPSIRMRGGSERLPRLGELTGEGSRAVTLARFAHHEMMAVELFAWALLRWPEMPAPLRRGMLHALADEQEHLALYVARLEALGSRLEDHVLSDYFWQHVPAIEASANGPLAFLCSVGLTFEQANLDFSLLYRDAFRAAGDEECAKVMQRVHDDEQSHVKLAATWLARLKDPAQSDVEAYREAVPFPLSAARAKGRRFDVPSRRRAGLSEEMIEHVRNARPYERSEP